MELAINVTATSTANVYCKTFPRIMVQQGSPALFDQGDYKGCQWTGPTATWTETEDLCGSKFTVSKGEVWWITVWANGYVEMPFNIYADVYASLNTAEISELTKKIQDEANQIKEITMKNNQLSKEYESCKAGVHAGGMSTGGVAGLVIAMTLVGGVAGFFAGKFWGLKKADEGRNVNLAAYEGLQSPTGNQALMAGSMPAGSGPRASMEESHL